MSDDCAPVKKRLRAYVACTVCRNKRSKCDGIPGSTSCSLCIKKDIQCHFPSSKRNRGHYKPQVKVLRERLEGLEQALAAANSEIRLLNGEERSGLPEDSFEANAKSWVYSDDAIETCQQDYVVQHIEVDTEISPVACQEQSALDFDSIDDACKASMSQALKPVQQYQHQPSPSGPDYQFAFLKPLKLTPPIVDYLLGLFFHRYQLILQFVCQEEFMAQKANGCGPMLRESLFLAMLAIALRYNTRPEIHQAYLGPNRENILATAAKQALEKELKESDMTTVKALLILAEVETSDGHDMTGFLYFNMAARLIIDLRLYLGLWTIHPDLNLTEKDIECRHYMIWAASVGDQYWSISLRKPLTIKIHTLQTSRITTKFIQSKDDEIQHSASSIFEQEVRENLFDLLELSREITDSMYGTDSTQATIDKSSLIFAIHSKLEDWFSKLPKRIKRGPVSGEDSYYFLYIMHLLYHADKIILFRDIIKEKSEGPPPFINLRSIIVSAAISIAKICETYKRGEDLRRLQTTGTQWVSLAAYALIEHIEFLPAEEVVEAIAHLQSLARTLKYMSKTFQLAIQASEIAYKHAQQLTKQLIDEEFSPNDQHFFSTDNFADLTRMHPPNSIQKSNNQLSQFPISFPNSSSIQLVQNSTYSLPEVDTSFGEQTTQVANSIVPESLTETWNWNFVLSNQEV